MKDEIKKVEEFLSSKDFIVFALFFGSFARGLANDISDADLGIYVERDISILEYGDFVSQFTKPYEQKSRPHNFEQLL
ncbi:MAG: nucleotidyltransferase domain-containing protein [Caldisericum sp.]|uniref:nucleotidyltransferase domain-containing protein n=1 Tax=Caldisericum sp. TaxID=2499687 RepID=UPI003D0C14CB